jgi:hypothetical protein
MIIQVQVLVFEVRHSRSTRMLSKTRPVSCGMLCYTAPLARWTTIKPYLVQPKQGVPV